MMNEAQDYNKMGSPWREMLHWGFDISEIRTPVAIFTFIFPTDTFGENT